MIHSSGQPLKRAAGLLCALVLGVVAFNASAEDSAGSRSVAITLVKDVNPGTTSLSISILTEQAGQLAFTAQTAAAGVELWKSDGTDAGTVQVLDINPGTFNSNPSSYVTLNNTGVAYFTATTQLNGQELWRSDLTAAGTTLVKDIFVGTQSANIGGITAVGGLIIFQATETVAAGPMLFSSDLTSAGTVIIKDLNGASTNDPGFSGVITINNNRDAAPSSDFVNGFALFTANSNGTGAFDLWRTDGTAAGTTLVKRIVSTLSTPTSISPPSSATLINNRVVFSFDVFNGTITNNELWTTDMTDAGTVQLKGDFLSSLSPLSFQQLDQFGNPQSENTFNGNLLFLNEARGANTASELWRTDGTVGGTALVKDVNPGTFLSNISGFIPFGSVFLFRATDQVNGTELWSTDVTTAGTNLLKDINPGTFNGFPSFLQVNDGLNTNVPKFGNTVFFQAADQTSGSELWKSDGTAAGTVLVRDINPGTNSTSLGNLHVLGGALFFSAFTAAEGTELWRTDGTTAGTTLVKDIFPGSTGSSSPQTFNLLGGRLVFTATDPVAGREVWSTDGTNAGTTLLKDLDPGTSNSNPSLSTNFGRQAIGSAFTTAAGNEVLASDGTAAGTTITDVNPGTFNSGISLPGTVAANRLFFTATTQAVGTELFALSIAEIADPPAIVSFLNKGGEVGKPFSYQIRTTGNKNLAIVKMASNLPPGLTFATTEKNKGYLGNSSSGRTGDGFIVGTPTTPGIYNVTLTADNGAGVTTKTLLVIIPGKGTSFSDIDSDEDGFPDELEIFLGSDPNDPNSTPTGGSKADKTAVFTVDRLQIALDFNTTGKDAFAVSGTVPTGSGFSFAGQRFVIGIGGVYKLFILDAKGKAKSSDKKDQVVVGKPSKSGTSKYAAKGTKQTFAKTLEDEGLENIDAKDQAVKVPVIVLFNNKLFIKKQDQLFNLKKGKGKTKLPRRS